MAISLRESEEIQGNILAGFKKDHQAFLFVSFSQINEAQNFLNELLPSISTTKEVAAFNEKFSKEKEKLHGEDPSYLKSKWINLGITFSGFTKLAPDFKDELIQLFPEFAEGPLARAGRLGDVDDSAPDHWVLGRSDQQIDAILTIAADYEEDLIGEVKRIKELCTKSNIVLVSTEEGATLPGALKGHEHFGFKDGISQPGIRGFDKPDANNPNEVKDHPGTELIFPGEFVLGYDRQKRDGQLSQSEPPRNHAAWMKDGSFQVFRRLKQDVPGFWTFIKELSQSELFPDDQRLSPEHLAAKMVGRWRSGTPLAASPNQDKSITSAQENNFNYEGDEEGFKTPLFAHIRKTYPRNNGAFKDRQRRIMRRGIPFGRPYDPENRDRRAEDRGLLFMAFMASIEDQFEFIQQAWANNPRFPSSKKDGPDAVIGDTTSSSEVRFTREGKSDLQLKISRFVKTTGAVYAFAPSLTTLKLLATGKQLTGKQLPNSEPSRTMNVVLHPDSKSANEYYWSSQRAETDKVVSDTVRPDALVIGIPSTPSHNLVFNKGKTIKDLSYTNFYIGKNVWNMTDVHNIDGALARAMSDTRLNQIIAQYFNNARITSTFKGQDKPFITSFAPEVISKGDIESVLSILKERGRLDGLDLTSTIFNFMLPTETILTTDDVPANAKTESTSLSADLLVKKDSPLVANEARSSASSLEGLGGYHGSITVGSERIYYSVGVLSATREKITNGIREKITNGIVAFDAPWKNLVATFYHELCEARTDPDVEEANNTGDRNLLGWVSRQGEEIGDFPVFEDRSLHKVFKEIPLANGQGKVPIQLIYSNRVNGPEDPTN